MLSRFEQFLDDAKVTQTEIAEELSLDPSTISRKISGERPWKLHEIQAVIALLTGRVGRPVTYEELFTPAADLVAPERAS